MRKPLAKEGLCSSKISLVRGAGIEPARLLGKTF